MEEANVKQRPDGMVQWQGQLRATKLYLNGINEGLAFFGRP
jgi:hypothetical protein